VRRSLNDSISASKGSSALQFRTQTFAFFRIYIRYIAAAQTLAVAFGKLRAVFTSAAPAPVELALESTSDRCAPVRCDASFLRLSPISRTLRACATVTFVPNSLNRRLIQYECLPVSSAMRLRGMEPKLRATLSHSYARASPVVSGRIRPATQYRLLRSGRSRPTVSVG